MLEKFTAKKIKKINSFTENTGKVEKFIPAKEKKIKNKVKNNEYFDKKIVENSYEIRLRLTKRGMLLANDVFVEFI